MITILKLLQLKKYAEIVLKIFEVSISGVLSRKPRPLNTALGNLTVSILVLLALAILVGTVSKSFCE